MNDLVDIYLPPATPNKKANDEGKIHITVHRGKSTMSLIVPNHEEVYKVSDTKERRRKEVLN